MSSTELEVQARFLQLIGKPLAECTEEDAERFITMADALSELRRQETASFTSAADIVQAAKHEMDQCGCPYDIPITGDQRADARRIRVHHRRGCSKYLRA